MLASSADNFVPDDQDEVDSDPEADADADDDEENPDEDITVVSWPLSLPAANEVRGSTVVRDSTWYVSGIDA